MPELAKLWWERSQNWGGESDSTHIVTLKIFLKQVFGLISRSLSCTYTIFIYIGHEKKGQKQLKYTQ